METNVIYNEDCMDTMSRMKDKSVDIIITSPPYNMRTRIRNGKYTSREKSEHFSKKYKHFDDDLSIEQYHDFHLKALKEMMRVSPLVFWNIQLVTGSKEAVFKIMGELSICIKDVIIWEKVAQPAMHDAVLNRGYEMIIVFQYPPKAGRAFAKSYFERGTMADVWKFDKAEYISSHGAVFPKSMVNKILQGWTKEGDIVYDPFMGTGTTARSAKDLNRRYIGSELSKEYCDIAEKRLAQEVLV